MKAAANPNSEKNHSAAPEENSFLNRLVGGNSNARSWREKLDLVHTLLADDSRELTQGNLADVAIYLRFLSTSEVACVEDGRHFRPSHHARLATQIHERLIGVATPENTFLIRKILACLPSTAAPFQRAEPLTRIRDIAHRNDIPQDLKREIKTTLQNKLHRCAGPEDLATSAALLERITAPGAQYSGDFVEQFKIFHGELSEFFNASSLEDRLNAIAAAGDETTREVVQGFLDQKQRTDLEGQQSALAQLTELRRHLIALIEQREVPAQLDLRQTDIALEDFAFILLSEILNALDASGNSAAWETPFEILTLTLANVRLSGIAPEECAAIEAELKAGRDGFSPDQRDSLLRLKATIERARRLAGDFSDGILALLAGRAKTLGHALNVEPHAVRVFAEGEIRGHVVFQLAKLASALLRRFRTHLAQPPWDVLVTGSATGRLMAAKTLDEITTGEEPLVVLLDQAEGDEEIPAGASGIVLAHDLPHLSHLGVRARQAGVVFVSCEDPALLEKLRQHIGQWVSINAAPESVQAERASESQIAPQPQAPSSRAIPEVELRPKPAVLPMENITAAKGGHKADGARRLLELAGRNDADFAALPGLVVPFGVMEESLRADPALHGQYVELVQRVNDLPNEPFARATAELRELIARIPVPDEIGATVMRTFGRSQRLAVRSSANSEDLPQLAGAGLHESVAGVAAEAVAQAVSTVWASLWTERAAASRRQSGIPHEAAHMAVLIQPLVEPELSFILHTVNPVNHNPRECYVELAVGLGETLASGATCGTPFRMVCDKESGAATVLAFASFSLALEVNPHGQLVERCVNYSQVPFTIDAALRGKLGSRLALIAGFAEREFGGPQDVEGVVRGEEIILVQSRAQQGLIP